MQKRLKLITMMQKQNSLTVIVSAFGISLVKSQTLLVVRRQQTQELRTLYNYKTLKLKEMIQESCAKRKNRKSKTDLMKVLTL